MEEPQRRPGGGASASHGSPPSAAPAQQQQAAGPPPPPLPAGGEGDDVDAVSSIAAGASPTDATPVSHDVVSIAGASPTDATPDSGAPPVERAVSVGDRFQQALEARVAERAQQASRQEKPSSPAVEEDDDEDDDALNSDFEAPLSEPESDEEF